MLHYINTRWSILRRLLLIALVAFLPAVVIVRMIYVVDFAQIATTRDELAGLKLHAEVWQDMTGQTRAGASTLSMATRDAITRYDSKTAAALNAFLSAHDPVERVERAEKLIARISGASSIALDPEAATYYIGDIVTAQLAGAYGHWAHARAILDVGGDVATQKAEIATQLAMLDQHLEGIIENFDWLSEIKDASASVTRMKPKMDQIISIRSEIEKAHKSNAVFNPAATKAMIAGVETTINQLQATTTKEFEQLLETRVAKLWSSMTTNTAIVSLLCLLGIAISVAIARSLSANLNLQVQSMALISQGEKEAEIMFIGCPNENGTIAAALVKLKEGVIERDQLAEETRQQLKEREEMNQYYLREHERFMKEFQAASEKIASGNFQHRLTGKVSEDYVPIVDEINRMAQTLFETQGKMMAAEQLQKAIVAGLDKSQARIEFDMDGYILSANENYLKIMGYSSSELIGKHQSIIADPTAKKTEQVATVWESLRRGEWQQAMTKRARKDGQPVWLQASYNPVCDISGKLVKVVAYANDVTEKVVSDQALQLAVDQTREVVAAARNNDLTKRTPMEGKTGDIAELCAGVNGLLDTMSEVLSSISASSTTIASASRELAMGNTELSQRTEEQAASLEETAASLGEFTATVRQNADNAKRANELATSASQVAIKGGQVVAEVITTMDGISQASRKIADIIGVIDEISFQTNILALNAAVEAARAGEQGRGFAVVASEVRSLAQRSTNAAKEIKTLISDSVSKVELGGKLVESAGQTMEDLVSGVQGVSAIMADISNASRDQSEGIEQINTAVAQMDKITQQNAALVEEAAAAAKAMEDQTATLEDLVSNFQLAGNGGAAGAGALRRHPMPSTGNPVVDKAFRKSTTSSAKPAFVKSAVHRPQPVPVKRRAVNGGSSSGDWTEF